MYGSTEGTVAMINNEDHVGAVGFISRLFPILPINVIKLDENGEKGRKFALWEKLTLVYKIAKFCKILHNFCLFFFPLYFYSGEPLRDEKTGLCVVCKPDEEGEIVGLIRPDDRGGPEQFQVCYY